MKKFLSVLLILCVCLSLCSVNVFAEDTIIKNPCVDAHKYVSILMNNKDYSGDFDLSTYYDDLSSFVSYSSLRAGDDITVKNISEDENIKLQIELRLLYEMKGSSAGEMREAASYYFDTNGVLTSGKICYVDTYSGICEYMDDIGNSKQISAGESFTFSLPKIDRDICWALNIYYSSVSDNANIGASMNCIFVDREFSEDLSYDAGNYIEFSLPSNRLVNSPAYVNCHSGVSSTIELDSYYALSEDDKITVKNISKDENVILTIQLEALPFKELLSYENSDESDALLYTFDASGNVVKDSILYSWALPDLEDYLVLESGESFTFSLPDEYAKVMWAVGVNYYYKDSVNSRLTEAFWVYRESEQSNGCIEVYEPFDDVNYDDYFYTAVLWALEEDITEGTSATTFSPDKTCTNAEILTFLWRACGSSIVLKDVSEFPMLLDAGIKESDYYCGAYKWALVNNLIGQTNISASGDVSNDVIPNPNAYCNRGDVVVYIMYKAIVDSASSGTLLDISDYVGDCVFNDVPPAYSTQVNWAVANGITSGTSATTFSPSDTCTRAQIVTFLYRAYANN